MPALGVLDCPQARCPPGPGHSQGRDLCLLEWSPRSLPGLPVAAQGSVAHRARHLHPDVCAVQRGVAALPGPSLSGVRPFLALPAPHWGGEQVPALPPPVPRVMAVSILLLGTGRKAGRGWGPPTVPHRCSPSQGPEGGRAGTVTPISQTHIDTLARGRRKRGPAKAPGPGGRGRQGGCQRSSSGASDPTNVDLPTLSNAWLWVTRPPVSTVAAGGLVGLGHSPRACGTPGR